MPECVTTVYKIGVDREGDNADNVYMFNALKGAMTVFCFSHHWPCYEQRMHAMSRAAAVWMLKPCSLSLVPKAPGMQCPYT